MGTQQLQITLPDEVADMIRSKVAAGEYSSESEVVEESLMRLLPADPAVEQWLRDEVAPAYDEYRANPTRVYSVDEVRARLAAERGRTMDR